MPEINLTGLTKRFGAFTAVHPSDLSAQDGEMLTLLGPSGCGKTTTLRMVAGLEEPSGGNIRIGERTIYDSTKNIDVPSENRGLGMVFQSYAIWPHMTVAENVAYPLRMRRVSKAQIAEKVRDVLDLVGMAGFGEKPATKLSGGQQQRVALARALVFQPEILLLDEPLSNLDAKLREHMRFELRMMQQRVGLTALFVTHDQDEALTLSDRLVVMNQGRIEQIGTPEEIYERPATRFVAEFIGKGNMIEIAGQIDHSGDGAAFDLPTFEAPVRIVLPPKSVRVAPGDAAALTKAQPCLFIRPEKIAMLAPQTAAQNGAVHLPGRISGRAYSGDHHEYLVALNSGMSLKVKSAGGPRWDVDAQVALAIAPTEMVLYK